MFYLHLSSVFSEDYCLDLINSAKSKGFNRAGVNIYGETKMREDIRKNSRVIWESEDLAKQIELKVKEAALTNFPYNFNNKEIVNFGKVFRMYQYVVGEYFKPHKDGSTTVEDNKSLITVLVYLNNTDGGETILMPKGFADKDSWIKIIPKIGDVLLFQHDCWHSGEQVNSGEKYVLRTDIFYK